MTYRQHFAAMCVVAVVLLVLPSVSQAVITWDFGNNTLNGWTQLTGFPANFSGNGVSASSNAAGQFGHDAGHPTLLIESPAFNFTGGDGVTGGVAMRVGTYGGQGKQGGSTGDPANPAAVTSFNGGNAASNGLKGVGLLNTTTGNYDDFFYDVANGQGSDANPTFVGRTAAGLTGNGVNLAQQYKLHIFEHDSGSWGWTRFNQIEVDGAFGPVTNEVAGPNNIGADSEDSTQSNEVLGGAPTGRFVQVKNNGTTSRRMDIGEIEAFQVGDTPTVDNAGGSGALNPTIDLAYSGSVDGASNYAQGADSGFSQPHGANTLGVINAAENTGGSTWSSNGVGNFVTIDLGATFDIGTVRVHQRNDGCCQDRLQNFSVNIFADNAGTPGASVGTASYPGQPANNSFGEVSLAALLSADLTGQLQPFNAGLGYTYAFELGDGDQDQIEVPNPGGATAWTTILDLNNAAFEVNWLGGSPPLSLAGGDTYDLLDADVITGIYNSLTLPLLPNNWDWDTSNFLIDGTLVVLAIPEPSAGVSLLMGLVGLAFFARPRRRRE